MSASGSLEFLLCSFFGLFFVFFCFFLFFCFFIFPTKAVSCRNVFPMEFVMMKPFAGFDGEKKG